MHFPLKNKEKKTKRNQRIKLSTSAIKSMMPKYSIVYKYIVICTGCARY